MTTRCVFMGSPGFAVPALEALTALTEVIGVVTQPDRPSGRGRTLTPAPIKICADRLQLPTIQPEKLSASEAFSVLESWRPDIIIVAAYGQILRKNVLNLPRFGCLNLHASLLPRHRGAAPIAAAILAGDSETGITLMQMDPGLDTGPILTSRAIPISPTDTSGALTEKLATLAAQTLQEALPPFLRQELMPIPQDSSRATYAPQLKKENGRLDIHLAAIQLERQIRAYFPWPGCFLFWNGVIVKIHSSEAEGVTQGKEIGLVVESHGYPAIQCGEGTLILRTLQLAGKNPIAGNIFLLGHRTFLGSKVT